MLRAEGRREPRMKECRCHWIVFENKTPVVVSLKKSRKFMIYINLVDDEVVYFR